jgi:hypothetical protein
MVIKKKIQQMWHDTESGLVIPIGIASDLFQSNSQTYLAIKSKACAIEELYSDIGLLLPPTCDLACLIADAKTLSDSWLLNRTDEMAMFRLFRAVHLDRIADAILPLRGIQDCVKYLNALTSGSLDFHEREKSFSKNILWEIELWAVLRRRSFDARLSEPPDIVVEFEDAKIGIACKKFYSEKHVQNILSEAVGQIEESFDYGIVALNLDDLVPANQILRTPNQQTMGEFVNDLNVDFLRRHERHFRKYLSSARLLSALVSTTVLADVFTADTRFNNAKQVTIWTIPGLPPEKEKQLRRFYEKMMH